MYEFLLGCLITYAWMRYSITFITKGDISDIKKTYNSLEKIIYFETSNLSILRKHINNYNDEIIELHTGLSPDVFR